MQLNEYQDAASATAIYPNRGKNVIYPLLGLIGEVGEVVRKIQTAIDLGEIQLTSPIASIILRILDVASANGETAELLKKSIRGEVVECIAECTVRTDKSAIEKELGDVLWYESQLAQELGISLDHVGVGNITKLKDRLERGVVHGSGDNR
jgi:NTP pyrophosphatase (non-canonical NTP hydrolase)